MLVGVNGDFLLRKKSHARSESGGQFHFGYG